MFMNPLEKQFSVHINAELVEHTSDVYNPKSNKSTSLYHPVRGRIGRESEQ